MMESCEANLSTRGKGHMTVPAFLEIFSKVMDDPYHPTKNPKGYINAGIAENKVLLFPAV